MDVDLVTSAVSEEDSFSFFDSNVDDGLAFEGESCGICMDTIIDRGVLDCCQHWFCFVCIDNWATITNLCPLCQNEFQLITCVPVYDTIGSNKVDEDSLPRDDDWCIEGKTNTLSFPSYYIDENAVICLDGDGCKIRNGEASTQEDSNLDTSIACDSCDIWYHAFCVGFDTESASESTWLCPRCVDDELPQKTDIANADNECPFQASLSGKVSVSVADDGETAMVVSLVGGNQLTKESSENFLPNIEVDKHLTTETFMSSSVVNSSKAEVPPKDSTGFEPTLETGKLHLSLSCDSTKNLSNDLCIIKEPCESESSMGLHLGLSVGSFLSVNNLDGAGDMQQQLNPPDDKDDEIVLDPSKRAASFIGSKRKQTDGSDGGDISADNEGTMDKSQDHISRKKIRGEKKGHTVPIIDQTHVADSDNSQKARDRVVSKDDTVEHGLKKEDISSDIMSIVQGTTCKLSKGLAHQKTADKDERGNTAGLRVKKIMKRPGEDKDSFVAVQQLRKEIRDAVRNKSSKDIGENLFDPELLAAFRAAVAAKAEQPVKKLTPMAMKLKKSILQKGKVRENLTKKIYANSNGRRKRAWDRDCEVEFWKHRCLKYSKPEKIETLNSVLNLLRKSSESSETDNASECQRSNPVLSRLYLADTSVFPRKNDIEPLSVFKGAGSEGNTKPISEEKGSRLSIGNHTAAITETSIVSLKVGVPSSDRGGKNNIPSSGGDASSSRVHSSLGGPKVKVQKEASTKPDDKKIDKRKWAMEVLARKNAVAGKNGSPKEQEDNDKLKGNYPLLAQLPVDMRPVLSPSRHNKIPISVRQAQLYRLTEFFLKKANLPIIRRTADTELAVADAINIEKAVADRSSSKLVYVNLCSQELRHRSDNSKSIRVAESDPSAVSSGQINESDPQESSRDAKSDPSASSEIPINEVEKAVDEHSTDPMVIEALQAAGLLSDSPPNSPLEDSSTKFGEEGPDNVMEMDCHPELDIYGDFEYSLDDEDYIGASAIEVSKLQPVEVVVPKLKVIFSTLDSEKVNESLDTNDCEKVETLDSSCLHESGTDKSCIPQETSLTEEGEELSIAECEELYGPDKEPLIKKFPESMKNVLPTIGDNPSGENSVNHSQEGGSVPGKEKKSDISKNSQSGDVNSVAKKVEAYIKEHIRPLCKSGVITVEQYRWAISKTLDKVMKHHCKAKNANFLIKEGEKVKKLAEQYVESAQQN